MIGCAIVGVTGLLGSGKSTVVDLLSELASRQTIRVYKYSLSSEIADLLHRFGHGDTAWLTLSPELIAELQEDLNRGQLQSRENKVAVANDLRRRYGNGVLAQCIAERIGREIDTSSILPTLIIIDSIRNPGEVAQLRATWGGRFRLLAVEAPVETLVARILSRRRSDEDPKTLDDPNILLELRQQDSGVGQPNWGLHVLACIQIADWCVINDGSVGHLMDDLRRFWDKVLTVVWYLGETDTACQGS